MRKSYDIAAFYFQRIARRPFLILFLLAIPFTLVLAEFAAFGRSVPSKPLEPIPIRLIADSTPLTNRFRMCLDQQSGQPLRITEAVSSDLVVLSGKSPIRIELVGKSTSTANFVLEQSIVEICALQESESGPRVSPILLDRSVLRSDSTASSTLFFARSFPGLALFGALFLSQAMASLVWRDYEKSVQKRLLTMPVSPIALVLGPLLFLTTGTAAALLLNLAVCAFAIHPATLASPALWAFAIGFSLFAAGLQLATGLLAKSHRAAVAMSASTNMMLAFLGGGFVPLSLYPPFLRNFAYALPNGAAQAGIAEILGRSANFKELMWRMAVVWGWAAVLVFAAVFWQARKIRT